VALCAAFGVDGTLYIRTIQFDNNRPSRDAKKHESDETSAPYENDYISMRRANTISATKSIDRFKQQIITQFNNINNTIINRV